MALDLSKFERRHDFDLVTQALGTIRCGTLKAGMLSTVAKLFKNPDEDAVVLSRQILGMVSIRGAHSTGDAESEEASLTDEDIQQVTDGEVETFALEFVAHNDWLLHSYDDESRQVSTNEKGEKVVSYSPKIADFPKGENERSSQYLIRVLRHYFEDQGNRLKKMLEPVSGLLASNAFAEQYKKLVEPLSSRLASGLFNNSALEALRRNFSMSDQLQDTIKAFKQNTIDREIARATIEPELKPLRHFTIPEITIPENPLIETNKRLGSMLDQIGEMRSLAAQSAELIANMNRTALQMQASFISNARSTQKFAQVAIGIAVLSLVFSSVFSWLSYGDGKQQSERNEGQINLFQNEIRNLIAAQERDRAVLVNTLKEAHQSPLTNPEISNHPSVAQPKARGTRTKVAP